MEIEGMLFGLRIIGVLLFFFRILNKFLGFIFRLVITIVKIFYKIFIVVYGMFFIIKVGIIRY